MGLTIHFRLLPPSDFSPDAAHRLVVEARRRTQRLLKRRGFGEVTRVLEADPEAWWLSQSVLWKQGADVRGFSAPPEAGWVFAVHPGSNCESVTLGLCRYPRTIRAEGRRIKVGASGWGLRGFCKTQYASLHGWEGFLRCHRLVIDLLQVWVRLGVPVEITDEGGYWPGRDEAALRRNLTQLNRVMAGLAGALKDAADDTGGTVASPIFAHPQFERLEAEGASELVSKLAEAVKAVRAAKDAHSDDN